MTTDNSKMASKIENSTNQNNNNNINKGSGNDLLIVTGSDMSFIGDGGTTIVCDENANQKLIDTKNAQELASHDEKQMIHDHAVKLKMMNDMIVENNKNSNNNSFMPIKHKIPKNILMGSVQLVLSIVLVALGCLVLAREASLANAGSGLWAGAVCAVAGSLGIINIQRAQTAFLAVSLVCVASSTLAIAITGIGVVRDTYTTVTDKTTSAVTAGAGLLFILTIHFFVSVFSVYHQTLKLCTRQMTNDNDNVDAIAIGHNTMLTQKKVEEYIKSITQQQKQGIYNNASNEKLMNFQYKTMDKRSNIDNLSNFTYPGIGSYPVMLVPASGNTKPLQMMPIFPPPQFLHMQPMPGYLPADMQMAYPLPVDMKFYDRVRTTKPSKKHQNKEKRTTKKRRRSEGDILNNQQNLNNREALVYHGLDRTIAEDFLVQQEKCQNSLQMHHDDVTNECYDSKRDIAL